MATPRLAPVKLNTCLRPEGQGLRDRLQRTRISFNDTARAVNSYSGGEAARIRPVKGA